MERQADRHSTDMPDRLMRDTTARQQRETCRWMQRERGREGGGGGKEMARQTDKQSGGHADR